MVGDGRFELPTSCVSWVGDYLRINQLRRLSSNIVAAIIPRIERKPALNLSRRRNKMAGGEGFSVTGKSRTYR